MWECPVCKKENDDNTAVCLQCRLYDASCDYEKYPTLQPITAGGMTVSALQKKYKEMQDTKRIALIETMKQLPEYKAMEKRVAELVEENRKKNTVLEDVLSTARSQLEEKDRQYQDLKRNYAEIIAKTATIEPKPAEAVDENNGSIDENEKPKNTKNPVQRRGAKTGSVEVGENSDFAVKPIRTSIGILGWKHIIRLMAEWVCLAMVAVGALASPAIGLIRFPYCYWIGLPAMLLYCILDILIIPISYIWRRRDTKLLFLTKRNSILGMGIEPLRMKVHYINQLSWKVKSSQEKLYYSSGNLLVIIRMITPLVIVVIYAVIFIMVLSDAGWNYFPEIINSTIMDYPIFEVSFFLVQLVRCVEWLECKYESINVLRANEIIFRNFCVFPVSILLAVTVCLNLYNLYINEHTKIVKEAEHAVIEYANGDVYEGEVLNGKRHGHGVMSYANGETYKGDWVTDKKHGIGVMNCEKWVYEGDWAMDTRIAIYKADIGSGDPITECKTIKYANGDIYEGNILDGKRQGFGYMKYKRGTVYEGEWAYDEATGYGIKTFMNGNDYKGQFKNGSLNGYGVYTWASGSVYEGEFKNGRKSGYGVLFFIEGDIYKGEYKDDKRSGYGVYIWPSGQVYEGEWLRGNYNGYGVMKYPDGTSYSGEWSEDYYNGMGIFKDSHYIYCGNWVDGVKNGYGIIMFNSNDIYRGEFKDGQYNGYGVMVYADGTVKSGEWADGEFVK